MQLDYFSKSFIILLIILLDNKNVKPELALRKYELEIFL